MPVLFDAPWAPFFIAVTFLLHPWLGMVALAGATVLLLIALLNEAATRRLSNEAASDAIMAGAFANSALRNAEAIEAMGLGGAIARRRRRQYEPAMARQLRVAERTGTVMALAKFWRPLLQVLMLSAGAWLAIQQVITPGVMIAGSIIMARGLAPVEAAISSWRGFSAARRARRRINELLSRHRPDPSLPLPRPSGTVELTNLFVAPPRTAKPVLKGIALSLAPGEALAVLGPSAAGKSTLVRALVGVWPPVSGEIRFDGAALADYDRAVLGGSVGYLPQDVELFDGTVAENIARFGEPDPEMVIAAARLAGRARDDLAASARLRHADRPPVKHSRAASGNASGWRARFTAGHSLVVLDEPNTSLDGDGEDRCAPLSRPSRKSRSPWSSSRTAQICWPVSTRSWCCAMAQWRCWDRAPRSSPGSPARCPPPVLSLPPEGVDMTAATVDRPIAIHRDPRGAMLVGLTAESGWSSPVSVAATAPLASAVIGSGGRRQSQAGSAPGRRDRARHPGAGRHDRQTGPGSAAA